MILIHNIVGWFGWIFLATGSLGIVAGLIAYWYLRRSLPVVRGSVALPGLTEDVEIIRDVDGVPHIYSNSDTGVYFGLGYVHAQERLWQMETQRRLGSGRLAEVFGRKAVPMDRYMRTVGMHLAADRAWRLLPEQSRKTVDAYTAGINAFIRTACKKAQPPEFFLLRVRPEEWRGPDVMLCGKLMAWNLGGLFFLQLLREDLVKKLGVERAQELMPDSTIRLGRPEPGPGVAAETAFGLALPREFSPQGQHGGGIGSNSWVVSGKRSAGAKPVLACDPHLSTSTPGTFFVAHLCADGLNVIGATVPGLPCVIIGRNEDIAWGMTNLNAANQDLFPERPNTAGQTNGAADDEGVAEELVEVIKVRGKPDLPMKVRITARGPIISDAMNENNAELPKVSRREPRPTVSLSWTGLGEDDNTLTAFLAINRARNWAEFTEASADYVAPAVNLTYADAEGNIGYRALGRVPLRRAQPCGRLREAWSDASAWSEFLSPEQLPSLYNPAEGFIVSANTRNKPDDYPFVIGPDMVEPFRHLRIHELLTSKDKITMQDHALIQADTVSLHARELLPALLACVDGRSSESNEEIEMLRHWDCDMRGGSVEACIFAAWVLRLPHALLGEELGPALLRDYEPWFTYIHRYLKNLPGANGSSQAQCHPVREALREAIRDLRKKLGPDMKSWRWDRLHRAVFPHQPFQNFPVLQRWFSHSVPGSGDWSTVNAGGMWTRAKPFQQLYGATYRQIADLADPDGGLFILAPGQSGHFLSQHYADYLPDWCAGGYRRMRMTRSTVERDSKSSLTLKPLPDRSGNASERKQP